MTKFVPKIGRGESSAHFSLMILAFSLLSSPVGLPAAAAEGFDQARLERLLRSRRVMELREAAKILRRNPRESMDVLPQLSRRANHPELTRVFNELLAQADSDLLQVLLADDKLQQRDLVEAALVAGAKTSGKARGPASATSLGVSSESSVPRTRSTTIRNASPRGASAGVAESRGMSPGSHAAADSISPVRISGVSGQSFEQQLAMLMSGPELTQQQLDEVYALMDSDLSHNPRKAYILQMGGRVLTRQFFRNPSDAYERFVSTETKHPERLVSLVCRRSPRPDNVNEKIWELAQSEDHEIRKIALRYFQSPRGKEDEYATTLMEWGDESPERRSEVSFVVSRSAFRASETVKMEAFRWLMKGIEIDTDSIPVEKQSRIIFPSTSMAISVVAQIPIARQEQLLGEIIEAARFSEVSLQYVKLIDALGCDRSEAVPDLRAMMVKAEGDRQRMEIGCCLYRSAGHDDAVFKMMRDVLYRYDEPADTDLLIIALGGLKSSGTHAKDHVDRLLVIYDQTKMLSVKNSIVGVWGAIGPDAAKVVPRLVSDFPQLKSTIYRVNTIQALGAFGDRGKAAIPLLIEQVESKDFTLQRKAIDALKSISPGDMALRQRVVEAIGANKGLEMHLDREWKTD